MKEKIKAWYKFGLWSKEMVRNAVVKAVLTAAEYQEITGEEYHWGRTNFVRLDPDRAVAHIVNMPQIPAATRALLLRRD